MLVLPLIVTTGLSLSAFFAPADPLPAVTPLPSPTVASLPVIGRSHSQRYCALETDRTNGAITVALLNDKIVAAGISRLRAANLDRPELTVIEREKSMHDLRAVAAAIQTNLRAGNAQVADLRVLAVREPDADRSPELKALADRIDDTLEQQRSVGADLAKFLTIVEGRNARSQGSLLAAGSVPETAQEHVHDGIIAIDGRAAYEPLNELFNDVADNFADRSIEIGRAEDAAAIHASKAVAGC